MANIYGTNGSDTINGGADIDYISGAPLGGDPALEVGNDILNGNGGGDTLVGWGGDDTLNGGAGYDILYGGLGNDTLDVGTDGGSADGEEGNDTLIGSAVHDNLSGGTGDDNLSGGAGDDNLEGGAGDDTINAGAGNDRLYDDLSVILSNSNDTLNGQAGDDVIQSSRGADSIDGGRGIDVAIIDRSDATADLSFMMTGTTTTLVGDGTTVINVENITLYGGSGNDTFTSMNRDPSSFYGSFYGYGGDDTLSSGTPTDTLVGGLGNDTLTASGGARALGEEGDDILNISDGSSGYGGEGDDTYLVRQLGDQLGGEVIERAGEGTDTVRATITFTLYGDVENLTLLGTGAIDGTGNALNNALTGNSAANTLTGLGGRDILDGRGGADTMAGGTQDDIYYVDNIADVVTELFNQGGDTVRATVAYALSANVETLVLLGTAAIDGTGNGLANVITGNSAANVLDGGSGKDTLRGAGGDDTLIGGDGNDLLTGSAGADSLSGGLGDDTFIFLRTGDSKAKAATRDTIMDFAAGDLIDVSAIDADTGVAGDQAFVLDTGGSFSAGEIKLQAMGADLLVSFNQDADAKAEMTILVLNATSLAAPDFVL